MAIASATVAWPQTPDAGRVLFEARCAVCHGNDGNGGEFGAGIVSAVGARTDTELAALVRGGIPNRGMPAIALSDAEMSALTRQLRSLVPARRGGPAPKTIRVNTPSGSMIEGTVIHEGAEDVQLRTNDGAIQLLRREGSAYRVVTSQTDWPSYDGGTRGFRYSQLKQIDRTNVGRLGLKWIFSMTDTSPLETTPVVVDGILYATSANQCYALDAGSGRQLWHFQRPRTKGVVANAANGINRGVAVAGDRVFLATDHAHLLALNRFTGAVAWEIEMADWRQNYSATSAPLAISGMVVSGMAGGDAGARGFVAAFDQETGKERWRFWTAPLPGEPGSETWVGKTIEHPAAATWLTGSYDADLNTIYWATGNPGSDHNGDERGGDNLYSDSVVALDAKTGKLKWHYQFTPHDVWDWDAQEPLALIDTEWQGRARKLLVQANRNGFFYVLDRVDGKLLRATPFVKKLTWAREIGADGRPVLNPGQQSEPGGTRVCPALLGGTNWWSTAFDPASGLYFVQTLEMCSIYTKRDTTWEAGRTFMGGGTRDSAQDRPQKILRAIDVKTGAIAWELPEIGPGTVRGGALATAGGLVFFCDDSDSFAAVDSSNGKVLWRFPTNQWWRASPMTYQFDGRQMVAVASGANVLAFGM